MSYSNHLVGLESSSKRLIDFLQHPRVQTYIWDLIRVASYPNLWLKSLSWRWFKRYKRVKLNLGCGARYVPGWINMDGKPFMVRKDMWLDLRNGLPFGDGQVELIYFSHVLEHLNLNESKRILKECYRVLKPGGALRVCVPSISILIDAYQKGQSQFFLANLHKPSGAAIPTSLGGQFSILSVQDGAHKSLFDREFLVEILQESGFAQFEEEGFRQSSHFDRDDLIHLDGNEVKDISLYVEARK